MTAMPDRIRPGSRSCTASAIRLATSSGTSPAEPARRSELESEVQAAIRLAEPHPDAGRDLGRRGGHLPPDVRVLVHAGHRTACSKRCQPAALDHEGNGAGDVDHDGTRLLHGRLPHARRWHRNRPGRWSPPLHRFQAGERRQCLPAVPADDLRHGHLAGLLAAAQAGLAWPLRARRSRRCQRQRCRLLIRRRRPGRQPVRRPPGRAAGSRPARRARHARRRCRPRRPPARPRRPGRRHRDRRGSARRPPSGRPLRSL